jgi:hypothetical protein
MPQEDNTKHTPYSLARKQRPAKDLPPSDNKTITPEYLLNHQNHFDPNVYTPEGVRRNIQGNVSSDTAESKA